jgi:uncharacterized protein YjdB
VVCLKGSTTLDNFNTFYGTALTSDKYVTPVISVDNSGSISALKKGIAIVTAKTADGNLKDRCFVIVKDNENTDTEIFRIRLNKTSIRIKEGKFEKLTPIITPGNLKNTTLIWPSDNTAANVTEDGRVFGEEVGTAIISVSTKDGQ